MSTTIAAAGAVLWRTDSAGAIEVAVVHRPRYDDWSLPKGKLDPGETIHAAAVREIAEETGFTAVLGRFLVRNTYPVPGAVKMVDYFAARAAAGSFTPNDEVDELRWLTPKRAGKLLSYQDDRRVLAAFGAVPADTVTVLLVRHGHAGKKDLWTGADDERPLSVTGRGQVSALTRLLPLFGPDRVYSAPKLRCQATVRPLAASLGVPVRTEPELSESGHRRNPAAATARLLAIAAAGGTPVVCSQGGVIPDVVTELAAESRVELGEVRSRKGSVWVLSFGPGLVAAHYIDRPG
ncbi:NUDIX hydrolase [Actinokineospora sp.]|uniref:NUDIX hydrolase n=1 Tax=Actinokineospora sp. TaxID=1872133 RepID=UPI0040376B69